MSPVPPSATSGIPGAIVARMISGRRSERCGAFPGLFYIHDLKTVCDSAGDVTELFRLQTENRMLRWECERLAAKVGDVDA